MYRANSSSNWVARDLLRRCVPELAAAVRVERPGEGARRQVEDFVVVLEGAEIQAGIRCGDSCLRVPFEAEPLDHESGAGCLEYGHDRLGRASLGPALAPVGRKVAGELRRGGLARDHLAVRGVEQGRSDLALLVVGEGVVKVEDVELRGIRGT